MKQTHSFLQGSPEWAEHRRKYLNASDASAAMGLSRFKTRSELMRDMATGITVEHDAATLARFAKGHEFEAIARPWAEEIIGDDLSPVVMSDEINGLPLSASFDGIDFGNSVTFEHKSANAALLAALEAGDIPAEYKPQMEQGLLISGATRCLFMASAGDKDSMRYAWYESDPDVRVGLLAAWEQFSIDLANFQYIEAAPACVAERPAELPALDIQIVGNVVASNLAQWRDVVKDRIAAINTNLTTDQEFSDAKAMVKFLDDGEKRIELVKSQVLAQAVDINAVLSAMDEIKETMRSKRLGLDKTVKAREESIKIEIMQAGKDQLAAHVAGLNKRLAKVQMPPIAADWAAAIKGKRNLESMRGAVADLVAAKKIESNEIADKISVNLNYMQGEMRQRDVDYTFLFSDYAALVMKAPDDLALVIKTRIDAEDKRRAEENARILEAEREKMRREEEARATAKAKAEQEEAERQRKAGEEAAAKTPQQGMDYLLIPPASVLDPMLTAAIDIAKPAAQPAPAVSRSRLDETVAAAAPDNGRYIRLGEINALLGFTVTGEFLAGLGFVGKQDKNARLYRECDLPAIYQAIIDHVNSVWARMQPGKLKAA